jgi:hypothetical protein
MPSVPPAAGDQPALNGEAEGNWLKLAEAGSIDETMTRVPEIASDPFRTRKSRLESTLSLYRFSGTGASLLDWAAMQSGLKDPLARFNRHELERFFERFQNSLDAHLKRLVLELKKAEPQALAEVLAAAPAFAKQALRRADAGR